MKPIETVYKGIRFRSRLEARWAVFFDKFGIRYEYEKQGYDLNGIYYLPDFWLPELEYWIEIKPYEPNKEELEKAERLAKSGFPSKPSDMGDIILDSRQVFIMVGDFTTDTVPQGWGTVYHRILDEPHRDYIWTHCPYCGKKDLSPNSILLCGCLEPAYKAINEIKEVGIQEWYKSTFAQMVVDLHTAASSASPYLIEAYLAARQARFEHGESGF